MATCSFIKATEARNLARNHTLLWTEICEVQEAILAAIDGNLYSTIVANGTPFTTTDELITATLESGGTGYSITTATATIDANGTNGAGALVTPLVTGGVITGFTVDNPGDLALQSAVVPTPGAGYSFGDVLTFVGGTLAAGGSASTATVSALSTIAPQDETDYAASFSGGAGHDVNDVITLTDGTVITVDAEAGNVVTGFTVTSSSTAPGILSENATVAQLSTTGTGTGFSITLVDANQEVFAVTVSNPGSYTVAPANPNSTTVAPAGGAGVALTGTYAVGYDPVNATATLQNRSELTDAQDQTNYDGLAGDGTFTAGANYMVSEVVTMSENSLVTIDAITLTNFVVLAAQDETDYDTTGNNGGFSGGDGAGGTAYFVSQTITLTDGTVVTVDAVDGNGDVTEFTVTTGSTSVLTVSLSTRTQLSTSGTGTGFSLTTGTNNEVRTGPVTAFSVASTGIDIFFLGSSLVSSSSDASPIAVGQQTVGASFTLTPTTNNAVTLTHSGATAVVTPIVASGVVTGVAVNSIGSAYFVGQPVLIAHPLGSGATASVATINGTGGITGIIVTSGGSGYEQLNALVSVTHPNGQDFAGTVQVTSGAVTGISIQNGGILYGNVFPFTTISDATGSGAVVNITALGDGTTIPVDEIASIQLADGGSAYSDGLTAGTTNAVILIFNGDGSANDTAVITLAKDANAFGTTPTDYFDVLSGQATDPVIADQIQFVIDYFTALGYNIRGQVNPATADTMQWQIIW